MLSPSRGFPAAPQAQLSPPHRVSSAAIFPHMYQVPDKQEAKNGEYPPAPLLTVDSPYSKGDPPATAFQTLSGSSIL